MDEHNNVCTLYSLYMTLPLAHTHFFMYSISLLYIVSSLRTISNTNISLYIYALYNLLGLSLAHILFLH